MNISKLKELTLSEITTEIHLDDEIIETKYSRLQDKEGIVNWEYSNSDYALQISEEDMEELEKIYQKYLKNKNEETNSKRSNLVI